MASKLYYWLVGTQGSFAHGNFFAGGQSKVVIAASQPKGYDYAQQIGLVGQSKTTIEQALARALPGLPTGISAAHSYSIPGLGIFKFSGPGGIAGTLDNTVTTGGNAADTATSTIGKALAFLTSGQNWLRLGEVLAGALLLLFGLISLSGGSGTGIAKKGAKAALL